MTEIGDRTLLEQMEDVPDEVLHQEPYVPFEGGLVAESIATSRRLEPHIEPAEDMDELTEEQAAALAEQLGGWARHARATMSHNPRWDRLRWLGLVPKRPGPYGTGMLPSLTVWQQVWRWLLCRPRPTP